MLYISRHFVMVLYPSPFERFLRSSERYTLVQCCRILELEMCGCVYDLIVIDRRDKNRTGRKDD